MKTLMLSLIAVCMIAGAVSAQTVNRSITLDWTATGDDGLVGRAAVCDIRYSTDSVALIGWTTATQVAGEPIPKLTGSAEAYTFTVPMIDGTKYFFALKTSDEVGNWSALSNIVTRIFIDTTPPAAVTDLR